MRMTRQLEPSDSAGVSDAPPLTEDPQSFGVEMVGDDVVRGVPRYEESVMWAIDIVGASLLLVLSLPVIALICVLIRSTSRVR